jgi:hypothetical protein
LVGVASSLRDFMIFSPGMLKVWSESERLISESPVRTFRRGPKRLYSLKFDGEFELTALRQRVGQITELSENRAK